VSSKQAEDLLVHTDKLFEAQREELIQVRSQLFETLIVVYRASSSNGNRPNVKQADRIKSKLRCIDHMLKFLNRGEY
jgi:hypothetical protein